MEECIWASITAGTASTTSSPPAGPPRTPAASPWTNLNAYARNPLQQRDPTGLGEKGSIAILPASPDDDDAVGDVAGSRADHKARSWEDLVKALKATAVEDGCIEDLTTFGHNKYGWNADDITKVPSDEKLKELAALFCEDAQLTHNQCLGGTIHWGDNGDMDNIWVTLLFEKGGSYTGYTDCVGYCWFIDCWGQGDGKWNTYHFKKGETLESAREKYDEIEKAQDKEAAKKDEEKAKKQEENAKK